MNYFIFDGESSLDYGVYIGGQNTFNAPQRDVAKVAIPGRNGDLVQDNGRFLNVQVPYNIVVMDSFRDKTDAIKAWLLSKKGYCKLIDTYHPDTYRMAMVAGGIDFETAAYNLTGRTQVIFDCKPERFLDSGDDVFEVGVWGQSETASGDIVTFEGNEYEAFQRVSVGIDPIQDLHGYDKPWAGGAGKNLLPEPYTDGASKTLYGVTYTNNGDGSVTANGTATGGNSVYHFTANSESAFSFLPSGSYVVTGCPAGGSLSTYNIQCRVNGEWIEETGQGKAINYDAEGGGVNTCRIRILNGTTVDNLVFWPMIRPAGTSADWEPYENICPITGHDTAKAYVSGKNLIPYPYVDGMSKISGGITWTVNSDGSVTANGTATANSLFQLTANTVGGLSFLKAGRYIVNGAPIGASTSKYHIQMRVNGEWREVYAAGYTMTYDPTAGGVNTCRLRILAGTTVNNVTFYPMIRFADVVDGTYAQPNLVSMVVPFGEAGVVYGGTVDVVSGKLTVTMANIASYNGEEIGEPWLSSMDDYTPGATPTLGAQVVYPLSVPQEYDLLGRQVSVLLGTNNVWADTGSVDVEWSLNPNIVNNPTRFSSRPKIRVKGTGSGTVTLENGTIVISNLNEYVDIDSELMNCYKETANKNADVALPNHEYPELHPGGNYIDFSGGISAVEVQGRWWTI